MFLKIKSIPVCLCFKPWEYGGLTKKRILGPFSTKAVLWVCLCLLQLLPSRKELSGKAESAVRRTTETTEGLDGSQESLAGAAKTKRGEKNPTDLLWTVLSRYVGTDLENHSPGHEAILLQRWKAAKRSESSEIQLGLEKRGLWVTLEPGRKSFRAGCPRSSLCVVSSSVFCVYCPKKLSCTKMCKAWASGCPKESSRRSCPHRSLQL